jgi:biotin carboxylase
MNYVFISPHYPPNFYLFCKTLTKHGVSVLGVAEEQYENLHPELRASLREYYRVKSLHDYDEVLRAVGYFTHRYGKIHRIESQNEYWLELEAKLREDFNVPGLRPKDMDYVKKKSKMKERFQNADINVVRGKRIATKEDAIHFIKEVGYPIVAKPDIGVGANGAFKLTNDSDIDKIDLSMGYFLEEYVEGRIVTFDGYADQNGNILFKTSHEYSNGVMEILQSHSHLYYYSYREIPKDLEEIGTRAIKAWDVRERFFHFEFFRRADNSLVGLEVNLRPPGGFTMDMFNFGNDIDLYDLYAQNILGLKQEFDYSRPYYCIFISRKNHYSYKHTVEEIEKKYGSSIAFQTKMPIGLSLMGDYSFIIRSRDKTQLMELVNYIWETE